jgi:hypothetical protein
VACGEELHLNMELRVYWRLESCLSSPVLNVWSQMVVGARPWAECRVIRVRSCCEYSWAAIGLCVRFDAGMRVLVVDGRDGVVWQVMADCWCTSEVSTQGRQIMTIQESPPGASRNGAVHNPAFSSRNLVCFFTCFSRAQIHLTSTVGPRPSLEHL